MEELCWLHCSRSRQQQASTLFIQKNDTSVLIGGDKQKSDKTSVPTTPQKKLSVPVSSQPTVRRVATTRSSTARPDSGTSHAEPTAQSTAAAASSSRRADVRIAAIIKRANLPVEFSVRGQKLSGILDSRANVNMMPYDVAEQLKLIQYPIIYELNQLLGSVTIRHAVKAKITIGRHTQFVKFLLYDLSKISPRLSWKNKLLQKVHRKSRLFAVPSLSIAEKRLAVEMG